LAEKVKGTFRRVAIGLIKEYTPEYASKVILTSIRRYSLSEMAKFADERRNLFLERWNSLHPGQRRKIRNFFSHVEREVRPAFGDAKVIREWLGKDAKRLAAKEKKTQNDYMEVAYINLVLNSPQIFSWVCWMSKEAGDAIFGEEEPPRPTSHVKLEVEGAEAEKVEEEKPEPEQAAPLEESNPSGIVIEGEEEGL